MIKKTRGVLLVVIMLSFWITYTAFAQTEKPISNYQVIYNSMTIMKDILERELDVTNVSFSYIPGFGSIFVYEIEENLEKMNEQIKEITRSFGSIVEIDDKENICMVIKYGSELKTEEYVIVVPKMNIADIEKWEIFNSQSKTSRQSIQIIMSITSQEAYNLVQSYRGCPCRGEDKEAENFVIIDVRTPEEYASGYIKNAINLDFYSETFKDELDKFDRTKTYLIYCRSGHRSGIVLDMMKEIGFKEVYNMLEGIIQWKAEGLPVLKSKKKS